jgi:hypothetical protein
MYKRAGEPDCPYRRSEKKRDSGLRQGSRPLHTFRQRHGVVEHLREEQDGENAIGSIGCNVVLFAENGEEKDEDPGPASCGQEERDHR